MSMNESASIDALLRALEAFGEDKDHTHAQRGGVLVVDNATSHYTELAAFLEGTGAHAGFTSCLVPVGKGEFIAVKAAAY